MAVTREEERVMNELQAKVASYLKRAQDATRPVERAASWLAWADDLPKLLPGVALVQLGNELLSNNTQKQVAGALRRAAGDAAKWMGPDGEQYRWAVRGKRDDGSDYTVERWLEMGNHLAEMFASAFNEAHQASTLGAVRAAVDATEEELAAAGRAVASGVAAAASAVTGEWSWKVKAALWGVGLTAGTGAAVVAWQALRNTPVGLALRAGGMVARKGAEVGAAVGSKVGGAAVDAVRGYVEREEGAATPGRGGKR